MAFKSIGQNYPIKWMEFFSAIFWVKGLEKIVNYIFHGFKVNWTKVSNQINGICCLQRSKFFRASYFIFHFDYQVNCIFVSLELSLVNFLLLFQLVDEKVEGKKINSCKKNLNWH